MNISEKCCFSHDGKCGILTEKNNTLNDPVECRGTDIRCKFRKTEEEYISSYNESVMMNRAKGNCDKCRYKKKRCQLLYMNEVYDDGQAE